MAELLLELMNRPDDGFGRMVLVNEKMAEGNSVKGQAGRQKYLDFRFVFETADCDLLSDPDFIIPNIRLSRLWETGS